MDLTVAIVSWNVKGLLEKCLKSVFDLTKGISYEVFVSDNGSTDGSIEMVRKQFPQVKLIENGANIGFTKANNKIIKQASGRYVILLNSDAFVTEGALAELVKFMDGHPKAGAVGPKLQYPDGSPQPSCRGFPTMETEFYKMLFLDQLFPKSPLFGKYMMSYWGHNDEREVDQIMGAAMFVRRQAIDQAGMLDENIVFWFDEVDWCKRIKDAGWKIYFTPKVLIYHYKNQGFVQWKSLKRSLAAARIWRGSRNYYFAKHYGVLSMLLVNLFDVAQILLVLLALYLVVRGAIRLFGFLF